MFIFTIRRCIKSRLMSNSCWAKRFCRRVYWPCQRFLIVWTKELNLDVEWKGINNEEFSGFVIVGSNLPLRGMFKILLSREQEFQWVRKRPRWLLCWAAETSRCSNEKTRRLWTQVHGRLYEAQGIQACYGKWIASWGEAAKTRYDHARVPLRLSTRNSRRSGWRVIEFSNCLSRTLVRLNRQSGV